MNKVAIVTDSIANIPEEVMKDYPIYSVPFNVIWKDKSYLDGIDIQADEFYDILANEEELPTTSQPSPDHFLKVYKDLLEKGYEILSIHTSAKLSGVINSAVQAAKSLANKPIEILDSGSTSMDMGFQVLEAAKQAVEGAALSTCKKIAELAKPRSGVYLALNNLKYLAAGGRIGKAAAFVGNALGIKPILYVNEGEFEVVGKVRTMKKAIDKMIHTVSDSIEGYAKVRISALYTGEKALAEALIDRVNDYIAADKIVDLFISQVSPVVGTHTGPHGVGLAFIAEN